MEYLIRLSHTHLDFRRPELEALSELHGIPISFVEYSTKSPYCIVALETPEHAAQLISRSFTVDAIYELWGQGNDYASLHEDVKQRTSSWWPQYAECSFRFSVHGFLGKRTKEEQINIIESFSYVDFRGPIRMKNADHEFSVHEEFEEHTPEPHRIFLGRLLGRGSRTVIAKYDLKKRKYISTTSMDAELALITANFAHAAPGTIMFDPFMGTGGFPIACSHFGAMTFGSDIDGRSIRGSPKRGPHSNLAQYGLKSLWLDSFASDVTNSPLRLGRWIDGIVCDPPYGVREGLKVLGSRYGEGKVAYDETGRPKHLAPGFIAPKRPYSFDALLDDILQFGADYLVDGGRLCMWMPTANDEDTEIKIPLNPYLRLKSSCVQEFNRWSRRLLTYQRLPESITGPVIAGEKIERPAGVTADDLNQFRKQYFKGFPTYKERKSNENK